MSGTDEFGHDAAYWKTREAFVRRKALENLVRDEEHRRASRRREADRRDRKERREHAMTPGKAKLLYVWSGVSAALYAFSILAVSVFVLNLIMPINIGGASGMAFLCGITFAGELRRGEKRRRELKQYMRQATA